MATSTKTKTKTEKQRRYVPTFVRLTPELDRAIRERAHNADRPIAAEIRVAVRKHVRDTA